MAGEPSERARREREHVDLGVAVFRERHRDVLAIGTPRRRRVDPVERGERLHGTALEREHAIEIGVSLREGGVGERACVGAPDRREIDRAVPCDGRRTHAVIVRHEDLFHAAPALEHVRDLRVGDPRFSRELQHDLVRDLVREAPPLCCRHLELLRGDEPLPRVREIVQPHLGFRAVAAKAHQPVKRSVGARRREVGPRLLECRGIVRRNAAGARNDAEELGEGQVVARHRRELLGDVAGVGAADHGEFGDRDVELAHAAAGHVEEHVDTLRAEERWTADREQERCRERRSQDRGESHTFHVITLAFRSS